jgi:hypothetical protein
MSYIDRDKVSLHDIVNHLKDHCNVVKGFFCTGAYT